MSKQLKTVFYKAALISMALGLLGYTIALAASGDLDPTFSGDGLVRTNVNPSHPGRTDVAEDLALQPHGKIVAVGYSRPYPGTRPSYDFAVTRYNPDGSLDTAFSGDGRRLVKVGRMPQQRLSPCSPMAKLSWWARLRALAGWT